MTYSFAQISLICLSNVANVISAWTEHNKTHAKSNMNFIKEKCQICEKEIMHKNMKSHINTHSKKIETEVGFVSYTKEKI